jgi:hypothetical protein
MNIPPHILELLESCVKEVDESLELEGPEAMIEAQGTIDSSTEKIRDALFNWALEKMESKTP